MSIDTPVKIDEPEELNGDCTSSDIAAILCRLKFPGNCKVVIRIAKSLRQRRHPAYRAYRF